MGNARQKRVAATILLSSLATSAFFVAQGVTLLAAAAMLPLDREVVSDPSGTPGIRRGRSASTKSDGRIRERNIFDSAQGPLRDQPVEPLADATGEPPDLSNVDPNNLPACQGALSLVGAVDSPNAPEWSFAAISTGGERPLLYRVGMDVQGHRILAINRSRVVLLPTGSAYCQVAMFSPPPPPGGAAPAAAAPAGGEEGAAPPRGGESEGAISQADMDSGIHQNSETSYTLDRSLVDRIIENQAELMRSARIVPHEEGGQTVGVKMYGIRRRSLLGRLGMMNGDVLRTINGFDMSSPDSALEAYTRLRESNHLTVSIVRRGQPTTIDYNIQ